MIRVDEIRVKKEANSKVTFEQIQQIIEKALREKASATRYSLSEDGEKVTLILAESKKFPLAYQIMKGFDDARIRVTKFTNEIKMVGGIFPRGFLEIILY